MKISEISRNQKILLKYKLDIDIKNINQFKKILQQLITIYNNVKHTQQQDINQVK